MNLGLNAFLSNIIFALKKSKLEKPKNGGMEATRKTYMQHGF